MATSLPTLKNKHRKRINFNIFFDMKLKTLQDYLKGFFIG